MALIHKLMNMYLDFFMMRDYLPVPNREVSMPDSFFGLKPLKRQMNVSLRLRVISRTFIR